MSKFKNKRIHQCDIIQTYHKRNKKINYSALSKKLNCSRQTAKKLHHLYQQDKLLEIDHQNGQKSKRNFDLEQEIVELYENSLKQLRINNKKIQLNFSIFYKLILNDNLKDKVTLRTIDNYLKRAGYYSPKSHHKTKREMRKLNKLKDKQLAIEPEAPQDYEPMRKIKPYFGKKHGICGDVVELDACQHEWFNNEKYHIYSAIDAATGTLLALHCEKEETNEGYYRLIKDITVKFGKPRVYKTDRRRTFYGSEFNETSMSKTLRELDIDLLCNSSPTHKPNVERGFCTMQGLFPVLFYKLNINNVECLNQQKELIIKTYNEMNNKSLAEDNSFIQALEWEIDKLYPKRKLKVLNSLCISDHGKFCAAFNDEGKRVALKVGMNIEVVYNFDTNERYTFIRNRKLLIKEVSELDIFEDEYENIRTMEKRVLKMEQEMKKKNLQIKNKLLLWEQRLAQKEAYLKSIKV